MSAVLAEGFLVAIETDVHREQPAYAPLEGETDFLVAYAPFFHVDAAKAEASIDADDVEQEFVLPCRIMDDGSIETEARTLSVVDVYGAFGLADPGVHAPGRA